MHISQKDMVWTRLSWFKNGTLEGFSGDGGEPAVP
jgi:hypothetical protein